MILRSTLFVLFSILVSLSAPASAWDFWTDSCRTASAGTAQWQNAPLKPLTQYTSQPGVYSMEFSMRSPLAGSDVLFGLAQGAQTDWRGIAAIVRFNSNNMIDVRDGDTYRSEQPIFYEPDQPYVFRIEVDLPAKRYSVYVFKGYSSYVLGNFEKEQLLAKDYAFRTEQQNVTTLDTMVVEAEIGSLQTCQDIRTPCLSASPGAAQWQNSQSYASDYVGPSYQIWYATPTTQNSDALLAWSAAPAYTWPNLAAIVRFNSEGRIDVRNGDRYMADVDMPYEANRRYQINLSLGTITDASGQRSRRYSVSVQPEHGTRTTIASGYMLRTEQQDKISLPNAAVEAELGGLKACYITSDTN